MCGDDNDRNCRVLVVYVLEELEAVFTVLEKTLQRVGEELDLAC